MKRETGDQPGNVRKFRVLGDLEVLADGQPLSLSSRRQEQLLAMLIRRPGHVVPAETLIDALWGERLDPRSGKNLQVLVHRLRRTLGDPGRIRHDRSGYLLLAQTADVDAWHFADLAERGAGALDRGDAESAASLLASALALWRDRAFTGMDDVRPLAEAAERLEQNRRRTLIKRIDADLALGRHARLVPDLIALAGEDPLAESVSARLMVAMHGSGQRTEALEVYRRTRAVLAEELGLEPGPQLRALERAILRGDADVRLEDPGEGMAARLGRPVEGLGPCLLPAALSDLTGRDAELRRLALALREESAGPAVCVVSGMAGVGKTALAVRAAHEARAAFPDGQLYVNLRRAGTGPVDPGEALGRFLRALGVVGTAVPDTIDERAEVFRALVAGRRVLVVLDDAADEAQVEPLLPAGGGCAVVITARAALTALPGADQLALGVLDTAAAIELLRTVTGRGELDAGPVAARLAELCGWLPLALRIAGARLAARPYWPAERLLSRLTAEHDRLDELTHGTLSVRASLAIGYSGLSEPARTLFRRLGLLEAPDFVGWVAAALLGVGQRASEDVLESLLDAQLVEYSRQDGVGDHRYRLHDLVRLYAQERAAADEPAADSAAALTRLAGAYLSLTEQAHRRQYGGDHAVLHGPGTRWDCGEATAQRLLADPAAWMLGERLGLVAAVNQAARLGLSDICWDLAMTAVTLFASQGHFDNWRHTSQTALALAVRAGDRRGEAAMRYSLGELELFRQRYATARPHLDAALSLFELAGDRHGQALTLRDAALIDRMEGRSEIALDQYVRSLAMLREVGDRNAEAHVLGCIAQVHIDHGSAAQAGPPLETALGIYRDLGDGRGIAQILNRMGALHLGEGRAAAAEAAYEQVMAGARGAGDRIGEAHGLLGIGEARLLAGDHVEAGARIGPALTLATEVGEPFLEARARLAAGRLAAECGDEDMARTSLDDAARSFAEIGLPVWHEKALAALRSIDAPQLAALVPGAAQAPPPPAPSPGRSVQ